MTRKPVETGPTKTEPREDRVTEFRLQGFIVDPTSARFNWASAECPNGVRLYRLVKAMVMELAARRPVALGIMMPTWVPITLRAAAAYERRDLHCAGLVDLNTVFRELRAQVDQLRAFVDWRTFVTAPSPKLYLWEAFRQERPAEQELSTVLASFMRATAVPEHGVVVATEEVRSVVGALLLRSGLTDDVGILRTPCVVVGWPVPDQDDIPRDGEKRDKEFLDFLVKQAIKAWFEKNGRPGGAKTSAPDLVIEPSPRIKRGRKPRA